MKISLMAPKIISQFNNIFYKKKRKKKKKEKMFSP